MLVILQNEQILATDQVCRGCLLANQSGTPRWHQGKLNCGNCLGRQDQGTPMIYECQMGFRLANIE